METLRLDHSLVCMKYQAAMHVDRAVVTAQCSLSPRTECSKPRGDNEERLSGDVDPRVQPSHPRNFAAIYDYSRFCDSDFSHGRKPFHAYLGQRE